MANALPANPKVALITGAAQRIGASIAQHLHHTGFNIVLHYHTSDTAVKKLAEQFNLARSHSAVYLKADLNKPDQVQQLAIDTKNAWGQLDALINNASTFYPTPLEKNLDEQWDNLMNSNLKGAFFLSQALVDALKTSRGCIVNIVDIYGERPLLNHSIYSIAKAGVAMMTKSLAQDLAPHIRVNGVSPGAIIWPSQIVDEHHKKSIINKIPLKTTGKASDIARTVSFLIQDAPYITGHIISVDGGRSLNM